MGYEQDRLYQLALKLTPKVGAVTARNLISYCGSAEAVFRASKRRLSRIPGVGETLASNLLDPEVLKTAEKELELIERAGGNIHFYLDTTYPQRLVQIPSSPIILFSKGETNLNARRTVAIVGTRRATAYGRTACERLVSDLAEYGVTIISGLAYGIDMIAHRQALDHNCPTIAVMGTGLSQVYPPAHRRLAARIQDHGALLTEFPFYMGPEKDNFPARNRIIAALADVVVVVESGVSGGSMITAEFANGYNRDVCAIPGRTQDEMSAGCNLLIKDHKAHMIENGTDLAALMRWDAGTTPNAPRQRAMFPDLTDDEQVIYEIFDVPESLHMDLIAAKSAIPVSKLASILLQLECKGVINALPGKHYIKIS